MLRQQQALVTLPLPLPAEADLGDAKLRISVDLLMTYTRINEPVIIEAPAQQ